MARISFSGMDDLLAQLEHERDRVQRNGEAAVTAGATVARDAFKEAAPVRREAANSGHKGHLKDHIKIGKVTKDAVDGIGADVYPDGKRDDGQRYATVGFVLEYGRSDMKAQPWMRPTMELKNDEIVDAMREELFKD